MMKRKRNYPGDIAKTIKNGKSRFFHELDVVNLMRTVR